MAGMGDQIAGVYFGVHVTSQCSSVADDRRGDYLLGTKIVGSSGSR
jgi:hypothetical protein